MKTPLTYEQAKIQLDFNFNSYNKEINEYHRSFLDGERVVETSLSCFYKRRGSIYFSEDGCMCVLWDKLEGESGQMGTSITGGTRRIRDLEEIGFKL